MSFSVSCLIIATNDARSFPCLGFFVVYSLCFVPIMTAYMRVQVANIYDTCNGSYSQLISFAIVALFCERSFVGELVEAHFKY